MTAAHRRRRATVICLLLTGLVSGCTWQGLNSLPLPGTQGGGPDAYTVHAQLPDVDNMQQNSRVRVGDVTVGSVTKIERQGWNALVTMRINGDVQLPANATATVGQTSLLGSLHIELAPPTDVPPQGTLRDGSLIPLSSGSIYPTTEQTLAALSMLLNGGGIGQVQDITRELTTAFGGREDQLRALIDQLTTFVGELNDQTGDIIAATESLNNLTGQIAAQRPIVDRALQTLPQALGVLKDQRHNLAEAIDRLGKLSAVTSDTVHQTKQALAQELNDLAPVLNSLANAGPALTRSLSFFSTFPWPTETIKNWYRGDAANYTQIFDLTLNRLDAGLFTGTRFEGNLTELEMQWGRTIGQLPSPYTQGNPLVVPYHLDQGP